MNTPYQKQPLYLPTGYDRIYEICQHSQQMKHETVITDAEWNGHDTKQINK